MKNHFNIRPLISLPPPPFSGAKKGKTTEKNQRSARQMELAENLGEEKEGEEESNCFSTCTDRCCHGRVELALLVTRGGVSGCDTWQQGDG